MRYIFACLIIVVIGLTLTAPVQAALLVPETEPAAEAVTVVESKSGFQAGAQLAQKGVEDAIKGLKDTAGDKGAGFNVSRINLPEEIGRILFVILGLVGVIFLILVIYGGILWMTAGGNPDQVKKAAAYLKNGVIGVAIILLSFAITWFVFNNLLGGGAVQSTTPTVNPSSCTSPAQCLSSCGLTGIDLGQSDCPSGQRCCLIGP